MLFILKKFYFVKKLNYLWNVESKVMVGSFLSKSNKIKKIFKKCQSL